MVPFKVNFYSHLLGLNNIFIWKKIYTKIKIDLRKINQNFEGEFNTRHNMFNINNFPIYAHTNFNK